MTGHGWLHSVHADTLKFDLIYLQDGRKAWHRTEFDVAGRSVAARVRREARGGIVSQGLLVQE